MTTISFIFEREKDIYNKEKKPSVKLSWSTICLKSKKKLIKIRACQPLTGLLNDSTLSLYLYL